MKVLIACGSGEIYILLASAPVPGTLIDCQFTQINDWRASGTWSLIP